MWLDAALSRVLAPASATCYQRQALMNSNYGNGLEVLVSKLLRFDEHDVFGRGSCKELRYLISRSASHERLRH